MSNIGITLGVSDIKKLRQSFRQLSADLDNALRETEKSIDEVSRTWHDENFKAFHNSFEVDKQKLMPLSKKISEFESGFLSEIERKLVKYINRG